MADFTTHVGVAVCGGALAAALGFQAGLWPLASAPALVALCGLGGIMPDIDADNSRSVRAIFTLLAGLTAFSAFVLLLPYLAGAGLLAAAAGLYIGIRYVISHIFKRFTRHRGIWHSLLAVALVASLCTVASFQLFMQPPIQAWYQGFAICTGMLIHLLLDECYSVDLKGNRVKRSFGTALKLYNYRAPFAALVMAALIATLTPWLPPLYTLGEAGRQLCTFWP